MWLFTRNSFISIVQHRERPGHVLVRARRREDLEHVFPDAAGAISETPRADYRWRLVISKRKLTSVVSAYIAERLEYDNFKAAQESDTPDWHEFLMRVWEAGNALQQSDKRG